MKIPHDLHHIIREGTLHIYTFKAGLLSPAAHNLRLSVDRFEVTLNGDHVHTQCDTESIRCEGEMKKNATAPSSLFQWEINDIHKYMRRDVLHTDKYKEVVFDGHYTDSKADGLLTLTGTTAPMIIPLSFSGGRVRGKIEFPPSRFGIPPFQVMLGAIKMQDRVIVQFDLPWPAMDPDVG